MFCEQGGGGLPADARAGNVVDGITGDREHVADQPRRHVPFRHDFALAQKRVGILRRSEVRFRRAVDFHEWVHELEKVLVVGRQDHFVTALRGCDGVAAHQVIGLSVGQGYVLEPHQRRQTLDEIELRDHGLRHFFARFLVGRLEFHSLLREALIPEDRAHLRLQIFQHAPDRFGESVDRIGRFAAGIGKILDREKRSVNVVMSVDQKELHFFPQDSRD